ncbi:MAG: hypothetical protein Q3971_08705 [Moraxella sp.]|nr:hypothetical protein [Moraxella sp.]
MAEAFQSNFVFGLQGNQYQDFIEQMARPEIQKIIGIDDYEIIGFENHLSFQDFKETDNIVSHIYTAFLKDIQKENGKVSFKKKVCITLDERLCDNICPNTGRKITTIKLAGVELAYFIYFDIKEFFCFVYDNEIQKHQSQKDTNIRFENDIKSKKESLDNKIENPEKVDEQNSNAPILDESIIPKLFSGKKIENDNSNMMDYIEKIGYIHNINNERGLSFVHETKDGDIGFPIYYQDFPEVEKFPIGTPIKAFGCLHNDKFYVDNYEVIDIDELPFQLMRLSGTLKIFENSTFAIIRTSIGGVYTSLDLIQEYAPNIRHQVECVAIEAYDHKRQENGWKAIWVGK